MSNRVYMKKNTFLSTNMVSKCLLTLYGFIFCKSEIRCFISFHITYFSARLRCISTFREIKKHYVSKMFQLVKSSIKTKPARTFPPPDPDIQFSQHTKRCTNIYSRIAYLYERPRWVFCKAMLFKRRDYKIGLCTVQLQYIMRCPSPLLQCTAVRRSVLLSVAQYTTIMKSIKLNIFFTMKRLNEYLF